MACCFAGFLASYLRSSAQICGEPFARLPRLRGEIA